MTGPAPGMMSVTDTHEQTECPAEDSAGSDTGCGAFGSFDIFLVREFIRTAVVGQQHGDIVMLKARRSDLIDGILRQMAALAALIDAEYCGTFSRHKCSPFTFRS